MPVITIHYKDVPIRIVGLPDEPKFLWDDLTQLIPLTQSTFTRGLELFDTETGDALNMAGVYLMIFTGLKNFGESSYLRSIERFFVEEVEPALRKYGHPSQTKFVREPGN